MVTKEVSARGQPREEMGLMKQLLDLKIPEVSSFSENLKEVMRRD